MMAQFLPSTPNEEHLLQINNNLLGENTARTQNKQLYSAWQQSEMDKKQMLTTIHNLNEQKVALGQVSSEYFGSPCQSSFHLHFIFIPSSLNQIFILLLFSLS
jgi:hypothetical protein